MKLRKRRSTEKQVEPHRNDTDNIENTVAGHLNEEEIALNKSSRGYKRVKLEETKSVLSEVKVDSEENNTDWEEGYVDAEVSEKLMFN